MIGWGGSSGFSPAVRGGKPMSYRVGYWCISHIGKHRRMNQDNFFCGGRFMEAGGEYMEVPFCGTESSKEVSVFGVFDGLGGEKCGEIASYLAAKDACALKIGKDPVKDLRQFCQTANADICGYAAAHQVASMGTTAAMLAFTSKSITLCNIGDSKVFRFCDGTLEQISMDHVSVAAFGVKPPLSQHLGISPEESIIDPYLAQGVTPRRPVVKNTQM